MSAFSIIESVSNAPKSQRTAVTVTVNAPLLERFDALGRETGRNRSELIDRAIEHYLETRADADIATARKHVAVSKPRK